MPSLRRGRRGDQRVLVNVVVPRNLTAEQRELLERFADTLGRAQPATTASASRSSRRVRRALRA